jgi:hypothetical protein
MRHHIFSLFPRCSPLVTEVFFWSRLVDLVCEVDVQRLFDGKSLSQSLTYSMQIYVPTARKVSERLIYVLKFTKLQTYILANFILRKYPLGDFLRSSVNKLDKSLSRKRSVREGTIKRFYMCFWVEFCSVQYIAVAETLCGEGWAFGDWKR